MGYHVVDPDEVDLMADRDADARYLSRAAGLEILGIRLYEAAPGEQVPTTYHSHAEQEEAFFVVEGTLTVETPEREYVVEEGQLFAVTPGNPHRAYNAADAAGTTRVLAVGAPSVDDAEPYEG